MEAFENMSRKTKIILSIIGIAAVVVPAMLLAFVSKTAQEIPVVDSSKRQIDQVNRGNLNKSGTISPSPAVIVPTPSPVIATPEPVKGPGGEATPASN